MSFWTAVKDNSFSQQQLRQIELRRQAHVQSGGSLPVILTGVHPLSAVCHSSPACLRTITCLELTLKTQTCTAHSHDPSSQNLVLWRSEGSWPPAKKTQSRLLSRQVICHWGDTAQPPVSMSRFKLFFPEGSASSRRERYDTSSLPTTPT